MPQKERQRVWRGDLKKTSGGLTKKDLVRNSRGKIVSKRKSASSSKENNLGKWLRKSGDSFGGKLIDAGKPLPKGGAKAPKPNVDRKIAAVAKKKPVKKQAPKPKPKPKPKPAPKPKAKAKAAGPKGPPVKRKKSPVKAGQLKNYSKISVGNILVKKKKTAPAGWPKWTETVLNKYPGAVRALKDLVLEYEEENEKVDWAEIKQELKDEYYVQV